MIKIIINTIFIGSLFIACNGDKDYSSNKTTETNSIKVTNIKYTKLSDSIVKGIWYEQGYIKGFSDENGLIPVDITKDENLVLKIGNIKLGTLPINKIKDSNDTNITFYPSDLVDTNITESNNSNVAKILQVLQTLDSDNNAYNGITITKATNNSFSNISEIDIKNISESDLNKTISEKIGKNLKPKDYAISHYEDTLRTQANIYVDTVAPEPIVPEIKSLPKYTNKNSITDIKIFGETNASVIINNLNTNNTIDPNKTTFINFDLNGSDNIYTFDVRLKDRKSNIGDPYIFKTILDTTKPVIDINNTISIDENTSLNLSTFIVTDNLTPTILEINGTDKDYFDFNYTYNDTNKTRITATLKFKELPNYESNKKIYNINLIATDSEGTGNKKVKEITININHINDEIPTITSNMATIPENTTNIIQVLKYDADIDENQTFTFSLDDGDDVALFNISNDGNLTFKESKDYENPIDTNNDNIYEVGVKVNDGIHDSITKIIKVYVTPINDIAPIIDTTDLNISENSLNINNIVYHDNDINQSDQSFTFHLVGGEDQDSFEILQDGKLSFKKLPDYENPTDSDENNIYKLKIQLNDGINDSNIKDLKIYVTPVNDISPILSGASNKIIDENYIGIITTLSYTDDDLNQSDQVFTYKIDGLDKAYFEIIDNNLKFKNKPDYETKKSFSISLSVTDGINDSNNSDINISLNHLNDEIPVVYDINKIVDENISINTVIATVTYTDKDLDEDQNITFNFFGDDASLFDYNTSNGDIKFKNIPDYENPKDIDHNNIYKINVFIKDGIHTSNTSTITISINNLDDVPTPKPFDNTISGIVYNNNLAIQNAVVVLQDKNKNLLDTTTDQNGSYTFDLNSSYSGPFILKSFLPNGDILYSYNDGTKGITNITPITSLILSKFAISLDTSLYGLFADFNTLSIQSEFTSKFNLAYSNIATIFSDFLHNNNLSNFNHIYNRFYMYGFDYDSIFLKAVDMELSGDIVITRFNNSTYSTIPNINLENIILTGRIIDENNNNLSGVNIIAYYGNNEQSSTVTNSNGVYSISVPNYNSIDLNITYNNKTIKYYNISTFFSNSSYPQQIDTVKYIENDTTSSISGYIYNGRTSGTKVPNVLLKVREGYNNQSGNVISSITSDNNGNYNLNIINGNYTFEFSKDGWTTEYFNVVINGNNNTYNYYINTFDSNYLAPNALVTAVLTWGSQPADLDTHLNGPSDSSNNIFHLYYGKKIIGTAPENRLKPCETEGTIATLDVDDTSSFGPETVSICKTFEYEYKYYIYNYSGSPYFDSSNAQVRIKTASGYSKTFNIPYDPGNNSRYWHVFNIDQYGNIVPINNIQSSTP